MTKPLPPDKRKNYRARCLRKPGKAVCLSFYVRSTWLGFVYIDMLTKRFKVTRSELIRRVLSKGFRELLLSGQKRIEGNSKPKPKFGKPLQIKGAPVDLDEYKDLFDFLENMGVEV